MSWVDEEGVGLEPPDNGLVDSDAEIKDVLAKFIVQLRTMGWSYRKLGKLFNRNHETIRNLGQLTLSPDPRTQKNLGRKNQRKAREMVEPESEVGAPSP